MPTRRALLAAAGTGVAALAGCSAPGETASRQVPPDWTPRDGEWADDRYGPAKTGHNPTAAPPAAEPDVEWTVAGDPRHLLVASGRVHVRTRARLTAYDAATGEEAWTANPLSGGRTWYIDGRLYDIAQGLVTALSLEGDDQWETRNIRGEAVFENGGAVYVGGERLLWLNADTGDPIGERRVGFRDFAGADGVLYAAGVDGVVAHDIGGGELEDRWRAPEALTDEWHRNPEAEEDPERTERGSPSTRVAVAGGTVYVREAPRAATANRARLVAFDADSGDVRFDREFERNVSAPILAGGLYLTAARLTDEGPADGELLAFDGDERRWSLELDPFGPAVAGGSTLLVGTVAEDGETPATTAVSTDGQRRWTYEGAWPLAAVGDTVYARTGGADPELLALRA